MHGGDIFNNKIDYDFSVNVNPYGPYTEVVEAVKKSLSDLSVYPQYNSAGLVNAIAEYYEVPSEYVCVTNGASEAINAIINNRYTEDVIIDIPSFYGYEKSVNPEQQLHTYTRKSFLKLNENLIPKNSVVITGNPSNPTGEYTDFFKMDSLYKRAKEAGSLLVIDESFISLSDYSEESYINKIKADPEYYRNLVVVRSFTKSFAIPALRLGYFVSSNEKFVNMISMSLPEWNVSYLAQIAGIECIKHIDRLKTDYSKIKTERRRLEKELRDIGFSVYDSHTGFILFTAPRDLYSLLLNEKILIRDCSDYRGIDSVIDEIICQNITMNNTLSSYTNDGVFRIAVKTKEENSVLINAMKKVLNINE